MEVEGTVRYIDEPALTFEALEAFAQAVAIASPQQQHVGTQRPPAVGHITGWRTYPDCAAAPRWSRGQVSMSIRIPSDKIIPLAVYQTQGAFDR